MISYDGLDCDYKTKISYEHASNFWQWSLGSFGGQDNEIGYDKTTISCVCPVFA